MTTTANQTPATRTAAKTNTMRIVQLGVLTAIMFLFEITGIGYLKFSAVEITIMMIPVVIGAITCGPSGGALLGGVFGLTSFIEAVTGKSAFGVFMLELSPVGTFVLCIIPRILTGLLAGYIFKALQRVDKTKLWSFAVSSMSAALLNTILFMGSLLLMFWNSEAFISKMQEWGIATDRISAFLVAFVGTNGVIEAAVCFFVGAAMAKALSAFLPVNRS